MGIKGKQSMDSAVIAVVGDTKIMDADVEIPLAGELYRLRESIYSLKHEKLNELIQEELIKLEARNRTIDEQTLKETINSQIDKVTPEQIEAFYQDNIESLQDAEETRKELTLLIKEFIREEKIADKMQEFLNPLRAKYDVKEYLEHARLPGVNVPIDNSPSFGPDSAMVTIVEFSDYMCPSCKKAQKTIKQMKQKYKGKIKWIFKDYPLSIHKGAKELAAAARCAGEQGKFWEYHDLLFSEKGKIQRETLIEFAKKLDLDIEHFTKSLDSKKYISIVEKDIEDGDNIGLSYTPSIIINGKLLPGMPSMEKFTEIIDGYLK